MNRTKYNKIKQNTLRNVQLQHIKYSQNFWNAAQNDIK